MKDKKLAALFALLAAALYAVNIPLSKLLLLRVDATMMAALLYLGAGLGMVLYRGTGRALGVAHGGEPFTRRDLPYTVGMVVLDIAAPILLMLGVARTTSANASLLNNFEIVATSLIALVVFHEVISRKLWLAILLVTAASALLTFEGGQAFTFNGGSLLVLGACTCWGLENNCTKMISSKNPQDIVAIKGCCSGLGSLVIALTLGESLPAPGLILGVLVLGFVSYGLSINFYITAQKTLGAAKTSAYYSVAPFLGVTFGILLVGETPGPQFFAALAIMVVSTVLMVQDTLALQHTHPHQHVHTHPHRHGSLVHTHEHVHTHSHSHVHRPGAPDCHTHSHLRLASHVHPH